MLGVKRFYACVSLTLHLHGDWEFVVRDKIQQDLYPQGALSKVCRDSHLDWRTSLSPPTALGRFSGRWIMTGYIHQISTKLPGSFLREQTKK